MVPAHQDVIRESAELLDALFDPNGNRLTTAHDVALGRLEDRISNALAQQGQGATGQRRDNLIAAGELVLHAKARQKQLGTLPVLVGQKLIKAHEALVKSVTDLDYSFEDIVAFAAVVKEMAVSLDGLQNK